MYVKNKKTIHEVDAFHGSKKYAHAEKQQKFNSKTFLHMQLDFRVSRLGFNGFLRDF